MSIFRSVSVAMAAAVAAFASVQPASAKPARCFTTDDGHYPCDFKGLDRQGSFEISAPSRPTYSLWVDSPGLAAGFVNFGDRNVSMPGMYERESGDPACWSNADTETRICAW